jgi:hypothetical protein
MVVGTYSSRMNHEGNFNSKLYIAAVAIIVGITLFAGCSTPRQTREVSTSGFLKDYSQLKPRESGEAKLLYINPEANFSKYSKIMFEPVTVWVGSDSKLAKLPQKEVQGLVNYLDATVRKNLKQGYTLVDQAGPDVMRLRIAITEGKKAKVALNTLSSVMPPALIIDAVKFAATGTHTAVGEASLEGELTDSVTGARLMAAVDARAGRKALASGNFTRWGDVQDAFDFWAGRLRIRLNDADAS